MLFILDQSKSVVAMAHQTVQELKITVAEQKKQIEALAAGLQKVSAQLELSKAAVQMVGNNQ
jgi:hypothetical protein